MSSIYYLTAVALALPAALAAAPQVNSAPARGPDHFPFQVGEHRHRLLSAVCLCGRGAALACGTPVCRNSAGLGIDD